MTFEKVALVNCLKIELSANLLQVGLGTFMAVEMSQAEERFIHLTNQRIKHQKWISKNEQNPILDIIKVKLDQKVMEFLVLCRVTACECNNPPSNASGNRNFQTNF